MANSFTYQDQVVKVGDLVACHLTVSEGDKTRTQIFEGLVIGVRGEQNRKNFIVRKIGTAGVAVERILPVECPTLTKIDVKSRGKVRRAKLYYLRNRIGKLALKVKTAPVNPQTKAATKDKAVSKKKTQTAKLVASDKPKAKPSKGQAGGKPSSKTSK